MSGMMMMTTTYGAVDSRTGQMTQPETERSEFVVEHDVIPLLTLCPRARVWIAGIPVDVELDIVLRFDPPLEFVHADDA